MQLKDAQLFRQQAYIDGAWVDADGGQTIKVNNPATGEIIGTVPKMGAAETRRAIEEWVPPIGGTGSPGSRMPCWGRFSPRRESRVSAFCVPWDCTCCTECTEKACLNAPEFWHRFPPVPVCAFQLSPEKR